MREQVWRNEVAEASTLGTLGDTTLDFVNPALGVPCKYSVQDAKILSTRVLRYIFHCAAKGNVKYRPSKGKVVHYNHFVNFTIVTDEVANSGINKVSVNDLRILMYGKNKTIIKFYFFKFNFFFDKF